MNYEIDAAELDRRYARLEKWFHDALRTPYITMAQRFETNRMTGVTIDLPERRDA